MAQGTNTSAPVVLLYTMPSSLLNVALSPSTNTSTRLKQSPKALLPIVLTFCGMTMYSRPLPRKASVLIAVAAAGKLIDLRDTQFLNI